MEATGAGTHASLKRIEHATASLILADADADAGGGIASGGFSPPRTFVVENRGASAQFLDVRWRHAAGGVPWASAPVIDLNNCPVIERNPGQAIQLRVQWMASAPSLRSAVLGAHGCGGAIRWR